MICSLALAMVGWTAPCHAAPQTKAYGLTVQEEKKDPGEKTRGLTSAEVDWQVIAIRQKGVDRCPTVSGWASDESWLVQTLRPPDRPTDRGYGDNPRNLEPLSLEPRGANDKSVKDLRKAIAADPLLRELDRFCAYTKKSGSTPDFPDPPPAGLEKPEKGRMALVAAGEPDLGQAGALALARNFIAQASGMGANSVGKAGHERPVQLVFVDTQPDFDGVPDRPGFSNHGYTLVHLADQLLRQFDPGSVGLATRLALPHSHFDAHQPPTESLENSPGGNLGLVDELAAAILREVFSWRNSGSKEHLVLNLSVGWDGELLGELDKGRVSQLRLDAQLVYKALQYARRSHALVIAAAGNRRGGGRSNWPLLPAAWELHRPSVLPFAVGPKPVYAVGGVDWQGLPLPNYRFGALPRRVAFGDHAMAQTVAPDNPTGMYTGSSVSTAVVSAIAAEVWHLLPDASPDEVMRLVTRSGDVLPGRGDYYAWKHLWPLSVMVPAPHMRRVSLCRAVTWACLAGKRQCSIPNCQPWDATTGAADLSALVFSTSPGAAPLLKTVVLPADCQSASDPTPRLFAVNDQNASDSCPLYLLPDMVSQRWVAPQPDDPPCPGCSLIPPHSTSVSLAPGSIPGSPEGYVLAVDIDKKWLAPPYSIDSAALDVDRYSGNGKFVERMTYAIPMVDLKNVANGNHLLQLKEVGNGGSLAGCTATLNFHVTVQDPQRGPMTYSVQSPVYVDPKPSR
jgi:hypothetical protein